MWVLGEIPLLPPEPRARLEELWAPTQTGPEKKLSRQRLIPLISLSSS